MTGGTSLHAQSRHRSRKLTIEVDRTQATPVIFSLFESTVIPIQHIMEGIGSCLYLTVMLNSPEIRLDCY